MTPSGWGDDAQGRDAGHDEMQAREYRDWIKRIEEEWKLTVSEEGGKEKQYTAREVEVEYPFVVNGRPIGFADIAVYFSSQEEGEDRWFILFFELKPRIYSVGSVIRQCIATSLAAKSSLDAQYRGRYGQAARKPGFNVRAIVYDDDPKAALLKELYPLTTRISREPNP